MSQLRADLHQLDRMARGFEEAAGALDRVGRRLPAGGDLGAAAALVNAGLAVATEGAARLASEAQVLGAAIGLCREDMSYTDAVAVAELFRVTP